METEWGVENLGEMIKDADVWIPGLKLKFESGALTGEIDDGLVSWGFCVRMVGAWALYTAVAEYKSAQGDTFTM